MKPEHQPGTTRPPTGGGIDLSAERRRRRMTLILVVIAALTVLVPFLFWRDTWFGRQLSDAEMEEYLTDTEKPRQIQHALVQIAERIERGDPDVERWYPRVVAVQDMPVSELRVTLAWLLGTDNQSGLFHRTLHTLLVDEEPMVRRNAALSLVRFEDASGKEEILRMLEPVAVQAPEEGTLVYRVQAGMVVDKGARLATIEREGAEAVEVQAPLPGVVRSLRLRDRSAVAREQEILELGPSDQHAWEALRALFLIGTEDDLEAVEPFTHPAPGLSERLREQAVLTAAEIRRRSADAEAR